MTTSAFHSRIFRVIVRRFSRVGSSSPSWMSRTSVVDPQDLGALLDLGRPPPGEDGAGHLVVADVAVGHADELDLVAELRPARGGPAGVELAVVGMGAEDDDPQRTIIFGRRAGGYPAGKAQHGDPRNETKPGAHKNGLLR